MGLEDQEITADIGSDITLTGSFVTNNNKLTNVGSRKKSPANENTTPDILAIIEDTGNILEVFGKGLNDINAPRVILTQDNELDPT